jgi:peptidoglycan/LPS O-acetylase OafA/YrhL
MPDLFKQFRRITYSTAYLPEVDGLRFLAIFLVVVVLHITHYLDDHFYSNNLAPEGYWGNFISEGGNGVPLFFVISGFILSLPFARWRLKGEKKISLSNYYLRRVFRLEPPYIIALVLLFFAQVWLLHMYSFSFLWPHLLASVFYLHTAIYHSFSLVLPISWSLEVEVQFYIAAPFLCLVFLIRSVLLRRGLLLLAIAASAAYWYDVWTFHHVFMYLHFFFMGLLLADLYCSRPVPVQASRAGLILGICSLAGFVFIPSIHQAAGYFLKIICLFFLVYAVLTNLQMKKIFSARALVLIGGMCYSIYLLHFAIISLTGHLILWWGGHALNPLLFFPFLLLFALVVLLISALYFLAVERPFMRPIGMNRRRR